VRRGLIVKVNTVLIPGINDQHIFEIAKKVKELGAYTQNIMPLIPQHRMAHISPPDPKERKKIQDECAKIIPQMRHCRQCRADAFGKLGEEMGGAENKRMVPEGFKSPVPSGRHRQGGGSEESC
jgi:nitrogen fixation protein NifB